ncbi:MULTISPECIES: ABC transporter substrate-binding protein [unclassified Pseudomonas]|uniref:substrate-binding periplasmic protein n=1 Tax=unclassified Pseudomonas TaxID=196821 RepID=UPI000BCF3C10|nr:polar amino acid transport system substrate-binding protein [Pseudomonas sp. URIL14HWK12:I12]PVZ24960.1 polar amino acid transport system substrate-binding protein [Pseudomonas sp. URIL14HWK12:I10]PVZ34806.1 polar amino acid transport system substrate-binding protein [Pseudomonas sp. URIL14HWK12:I11]SNZ09346.1 amino acid ABC transporter substrate-binding protein, PAAT family (TC 3.A.1.3.-) [Pseudomonas sp. URIL14HWK12:I9]
MRRLLMGCCLLAGLWLSLPAGAVPLRLVADIWPPFTDDSMPNKGIATDIVTRALARAGYASAYEQVPWARALQGIEAGRYDVLINAWFNQARLQAGLFSAPYLHNRICFLQNSRIKQTYDGSLASLGSVAIAVVRDYAYSPEFDADKHLNKVPVQNFSQALRMLAADRVDMTLEDEYVARYYLQREPEAVREAVKFVGPPLSENTLHILVSRKTPNYERIVADFDKAIDSMRADGTLEKLIAAQVR